MLTNCKVSYENADSYFLFTSNLNAKIYVIDVLRSFDSLDGETTTSWRCSSEQVPMIAEG
jgi:hypothetical protein